MWLVDYGDFYNYSDIGFFVFDFKFLCGGIYIGVWDIF